MSECPKCGAKRISFAAGVRNVEVFDCGSTTCTDRPFNQSDACLFGELKTENVNLNTQLAAERAARAGDAEKLRQAMKILAADEPAGDFHDAMTLIGECCGVAVPPMPSGRTMTPSEYLRSTGTEDAQ